MAIPSANSPQTLEVYTLLKIAAESFLNFTKRDDPAAPPTGSRDFVIDPDWLSDGNGHSSRMTDVAETFIRSNGSRFAVSCIFG